MKISITGANGFVGKQLCSELLALGHELTLLSRHEPQAQPAGTRYLRGDLSDPECPLAALVADCEIIYHCAGEIRDTNKMRAVHVDACQRLLDATLAEATNSGREIHWVQLSSVGVYGPPSGAANAERTVTETSPINPLGEYETTKAAADELLLRAARPGRLSYTIVRPSIVFGRGMPNQSLRALGDAVRRRLFFYIGRPGATATYVHVDDLVDLLLLCATDPAARNEIFNLSNDCALDEMVSAMAAAMAVAPPRRRLPEAPVRLLARLASGIAGVPLTPQRIDALVSRTRYPCHKARERLGFQPRRPVPESIAEVL